ncbi:MAG TPA: right-handed parallel beta-helix repeat-containing protein [Blastocatellia bacterium]|nr:right-handed parallel beta-helix repeat-containing protein [Blastocatellia bacterium]
MPTRILRRSCLVLMMALSIVQTPTGVRRPHSDRAHRIPAPPASGAGETATMPGVPEIYYPTMQHLSVRWPISGDSNNNGVVSVRFRQAGGEWRENLQLKRIPAGESSGFSWRNQHSGSVFHLEPGTTYEVELNLVDPDGGSRQQTLIGTTRPVPTSQVSGRIRKVSPASFGRAFETAAPGEIFELAAGNYGPFRARRSGLADRPIVIRSTGKASFSRFDLNDQKHLVIDRVFIKGTVQIQGCEDIALLHLTIDASKTDYGVMARGGSGCRNCYIADSTITGPLMRAWDGPALPRYGDATGIQLSGPGTVVEHNLVQGFDDGIAFSEDDRDANQYSIDIIGNEIRHSVDDGIEMDFCLGNCRSIGNRITNGLCGISFQPALGEPAYAIDNSLYNVAFEAFKLKRNSVGAVIFHNTVLKNGDALSANTPRPISQTWIANNLLIGGPGETNAGYESGNGSIVELGSADDSNYVDYNAYGSETQRFEGNYGRLRFHRFSELLDLTPNRHSVQVFFNSTFAKTPPYPKPAVPGRSPQDLRLRSGSAAIDSGLALPNVNDGYSGAAPDLGAYEFGSELPVYGPRPR